MCACHSNAHDNFDGAQDCPYWCLCDQHALRAADKDRSDFLTRTAGTFWHLLPAVVLTFLIVLFVRCDLLDCNILQHELLERCR